MTGMGSFLACYDYGQGGLWIYLEGESLAQVISEYPGLAIFSAPPPWWDEESERAARKHDPAKPPFKEILENARKP